MLIQSWDDWYFIEAQARENDDSLVTTELPPSVSITFWLPTQYVGALSEELLYFDSDVRRASALLPIPAMVPRVMPFAPLLGLAEPVDPRDGRIEFVSGSQEGSVYLLLSALGDAVSVFVNAPSIFYFMRAALHRLPFRIIRIDPTHGNESHDQPTISGHFSRRQADLIEANRITRRMEVQHPTGEVVTIEEFE